MQSSPRQSQRERTPASSSWPVATHSSTQSPQVRATRILLIDGPAVVGWEKWRQLDAENSEVHLREALTAVGVEDVLRDAMTAQLSGAMNEAAIWITQQPDASHARDRAHRSLERLIAALIS